MKIVNDEVVFEDYDVSAANVVLAKIIATGLTNFKARLLEMDAAGTVYGVPIPFDDEVDGDYFVVAKNKWLEILDSMIYAFGVEEPMLPSTEDGLGKWYLDRDEHWRKVDDGRAKFIKYFDNLWW